jgi:hypothetical protein
LEQVQTVVKEEFTPDSGRGHTIKIPVVQTTEMISVHTKGALADVLKAARLNLSLYTQTEREST